MRLLILHVLLLSLCFLWSCEDPKIVFPEKERVATIYGNLKLRNVPGKVYLFDITVIDSVDINPATGTFEFNNVPYGYFTLKIVTENYAIYSTGFTISYDRKVFENIRLSKYPNILRKVSPRDSANVKAYSDLVQDTMMLIHMFFDEKMDSASLFNSITIKPDINFKILNDSNDLQKSFFISLKSDQYFKYPEISFHLDTTLMDMMFRNIDSPIKFVNFPDTTDLKHILNTIVIKDVIILNQMDFTSEDNVSVVFRHPMDTASVRNGISFLPKLDYSLKWNDNILTIFFTKPIPWNKHCTLVFDSSVVTADRNYRILLYQKKFYSRRMKANFINLQMVKKNINEPLIFTFNFIPDISTLKESFRLSPPVEYLLFDYYEEKIIVYHSPLMPDTTYTLTIDSTLSDMLGHKLPHVKNYTITTDSLTQNNDGNNIMQYWPSDTTNTYSLSTKPFVVFPRSINKDAVEKHLNIEPNIFYQIAWKDTNIIVYSGSSLLDSLIIEMKLLRIFPGHQFIPDTTYTLSIDSIVASEVLLHDIEFLFTTEKPAILKSDPLPSQKNVSHDKMVTILFNTDIDTSTLMANIVFSPPLDSLKIGLVNGSFKEITITHEPFVNNTVYNVTILNNISDIFGKKPSETYTFQFITGL